MADTPKVVALRGEAIPAFEPRQDVIEECERLLEMARAGEIVGIAVSVRHAGVTTSSNFAGVVGPAMIGEMAICSHELSRRMLAEPYT